MPLRPTPATGEMARPPAAKSAVPMKEVAGVSFASTRPTPQGPPAPPSAPTTFKTIGYVEKADGQLEAIIVQENQVQFVHIGDHIAGRYRVTKITPDLVDAIDETQVQSAMPEPSGSKTDQLTANAAEQPSTPPPLAPVPPEFLTVAAGGASPSKIQAVEPVANSLGYVQQADGKVEAVVADGESVRLVPETSARTLAQVPPSPDLQKAVRPLHGLTESVSAASSPIGPTADPSIHLGDLPNASVIRQASYQIPSPAHSNTDVAAPSPLSVASAGGAIGLGNAEHDRTAAIFTSKPVESTDRPTKLPVEMKPLGFVVKAHGELAAILLQDEEVQIVRQGDRFAGRFHALRVSADAVEAVEDPPRDDAPLLSEVPPAIPDFRSPSAKQGPAPFSSEDCLRCESSDLDEVSANVPEDPPALVASPPPKSGGARILPVSRGAEEGRLGRNHSPDSQGTFIFQTLGYVETQNRANASDRGRWIANIPRETRGNVREPLSGHQR